MRALTVILLVMIVTISMMYANHVPNHKEQEERQELETRKSKWQKKCKDLKCDCLTQKCEKVRPAKCSKKNEKKNGKCKKEVACVPLDSVIQTQGAGGPIDIYCQKTTLGKEYKGTTQVTENGITCQRWDTQTPHQTCTACQDPNNFPETNLTDAQNYCRNPNDRPNGPWCYTTDASIEWQYCDVPQCEVDGCKTTTLGKEYPGTTQYTTGTILCQRWDTNTPHQPNSASQDPANFPEATVSDAQNYCRNPDDAANGPWCYTMDPQIVWQYCDIPICTVDGCKTTTLGKEYSGTTQVTTGAILCQRWDTNTPHQPDSASQDPANFPEATVSDAQRYCRNPNDRPNGPWCYTTDASIEWQYCDVPLCSGPTTTTAAPGGTPSFPPVG